MHPKRLWYFLKSWGTPLDTAWLRDVRNTTLENILKHCHLRSVLRITIGYDPYTICIQSRQVRVEVSSSTSSPAVAVGCDFKYKSMKPPPRPWVEYDVIHQTKQPFRLFPEEIFHLQPLSLLVKENIPDFLYQLAHPGVLGSSGFLKLVGLVSALPLGLRGGIRVEVAEGSGSFLSSILPMFPKWYGFYNSLNMPDSFPHSLSGRCLPIDYICSCKLHKRIINWDAIRTTNGDLREEKT